MIDLQLARRMGFVTLLLALTLNGAAFSAPAGSGAQPIVPEDHECGPGLRAVGERLNGTLCSHGPDPVPAVRADAKVPADATFWPDDSNIRPTQDVCVGDGVDGHRIHFFYAYHQDSPNQLRENGWHNAFRKKIRYADAYLDASDKKKDQHFRILCADEQPVITEVEVSNTPGSVYKQVVTELQLRGYDGDEDNNLVPDFNEGKGRIYSAFIDGFGYDYCGQGSVGGDDSPFPLSNRAPEYSILSCWYGGTILHEIGHNLGAVQSSAPHWSGAAHCIDENDRMCYFDSGANAAYYPEDECPRAKEWTFDCGHNKDNHEHDGVVVGSEDYWDPRKPQRFLATHWNTADSVFLTEIKDD